jgi:DnaJ-domain-containing protein 1
MMTNIALFASLILNARKTLRKHQNQKQPTLRTPANVRTISCPSCAQHIKFTLPIEGNKARCRKCHAQFKLDVDEHRNVYITEIKLPEDEQHIKSLADCYLILGLTAEALPIDIKAAYKKKISEYHPDRVGVFGAKIKQLAEEETRQINAAYAMLQEQGMV